MHTNWNRKTNKGIRAKYVLLNISTKGKNK
jgi:hypothetical protein